MFSKKSMFEISVFLSIDDALDESDLLLFMTFSTGKTHVYRTGTMEIAYERNHIHELRYIEIKLALIIAVNRNLSNCL